MSGASPIMWILYVICYADAVSCANFEQYLSNVLWKIVQTWAGYFAMIEIVKIAN